MDKDMEKILDESIGHSKVAGMSKGETIDFLAEDETTKQLGYKTIESYIYKHWKD